MSKKPRTDYQPKTKLCSELREDIIKQNRERYNKMLYNLKHNGILLSELKEAISLKLGGSNNPKLGCVYQIKNIINNKVYIGSTNDFIKRMTEHLNKLDRNVHHSQYLQNAWNKNGPQNFVIYLLEEVLYDENKYETIQEYLKFLREREQYYIDNFNSSNKEYGYNMCDKADTVYVNPEKLLVEGKLKYSKEFIIEICEMMMNPKYSLIEIAEIKNVKPSLIKDINQHRTYKETTKNYNFPKRNNETIWANFNDKKEDIYKLYYEGKTPKEIAESLNLKERDIKHLLSFSTIPQPIYIYSVTQELVNKFYMPTTAANFLGITSSAISHALVHSVKNNGRAFLKNKPDIIISRESSAPKFTLLEEYLGQYINPTFKPVFKYDNSYNEIEDVYINVNSVPGYKSTTINAYCARRKNGWSNYKDTSQEDIDKFLLKNNHLK